MNSYLDIKNKILEYERVKKIKIFNSSISEEESENLYDEKCMLLSDIHQQYKYFKTEVEHDVELGKYIRDFISNTGAENIINSVVRKSPKTKF